MLQGKKFEHQPLVGKTIMVTRAREQAATLITELAALGASCLEAPAIRIVPLDDYTALEQAVARLTQYNWLIFTSVNGVDYFFKRLAKSNQDASALGQTKIAAIGVPTAQRLNNYGIKADIVPVEFRAEGIVGALTTAAGPGTKVLIPRALQARTVLPDGLRKLGAVVDVVPVYQTVQGEADAAQIRTKLAAGGVDIVTFTSSSTVTMLLERLGDSGASLLAQTNIACIGPITAATCLDKGLKPTVIAENFTINGLVEAIVDYYDR